MALQQSVREVRGGVYRVREYGPAAAGGLRVRSMAHPQRGGDQFYLIKPDAEEYATERAFFSEEGARRAAVEMTGSPEEKS